MLLQFTDKRFQTTHDLTIGVEFGTCTIDIDTEKIKLQIWDTAGQEDYDHIRALAYKDVDCFLVCFSVDSQSSFSNVKQKWIPSIIDSESSDASIVLVGTKQDLRNDKKVSSALKAKGSSFVSEEDVRRSSLYFFLCVFFPTFETNHHTHRQKTFP